MRTHKVRIACVMNSNEQWNCIGWSERDGSPVHDDTSRSIAFDGLGFDADLESVSWITAEVPIPSTQEINGIVEVK